MDADDIAELTRFHRQIEFLWQQPDYVAVGSSLHLIVSAHHRHGVRGADEGGWSKISPS